MAEQSGPSVHEHGFTNRIVKMFLESNLSLILILLATVLGLAALGLTPREEDPQIVVPLADVYVNFPGHSAAEVEQLVTTPLEKILYQIDGVEYVYSMSRTDQAIITVRYYVGEDRERSLVKLYKKIDEHRDIVPPGVTGWVVKPVEIDDVPVVTLTLSSPTSDGSTLRRGATGEADVNVGQRDDDLGIFLARRKSQRGQPDDRGQQNQDQRQVRLQEDLHDPIREAVLRLGRNCMLLNHGVPPAPTRMPQASRHFHPRAALRAPPRSRRVSARCEWSGGSLGGC
jgi:hypothetical protein